MKCELTQFEALQLAVAKAGGQSALGRLCGVGQPAVWKWLQSSKRLPAEYVLRVEAATGVSRHQLRPDIYPIEHPIFPDELEPALDHGLFMSRDHRLHQSNRAPLLDGSAAA